MDTVLNNILMTFYPSLLWLALLAFKASQADWDVQRFTNHGAKKFWTTGWVYHKDVGTCMTLLGTKIGLFFCHSAKQT